MTELSLEDFLADPATRQLMARDQVQEAEIRALAARYRLSLEAGQNQAPRQPEPKSFLP
jgi:hypothetical protein